MVMYNEMCTHLRTQIFFKLDEFFLDATEEELFDELYHHHNSYSEIGMAESDEKKQHLIRKCIRDGTWWAGDLTSKVSSS